MFVTSMECIFSGMDRRVYSWDTIVHRERLDRSLTFYAKRNL